MNRTIERVARALARCWNDEEQWPDYVDEARAAIEAMRPPTVIEIDGAAALSAENRETIVKVADAVNAYIDAAIRTSPARP